MIIRSIARRPSLKFVMMAVVAIALTASVSACGRKGPLELGFAESPEQ